MAASAVPADPNISPEMRRFLDAVDRKDSFETLNVGTLTASELAAFALGLTVAAGGIAITAGGLTVTAGSVSFPAGSIASAALATPPKFSKEYVSSGQTITTAGALTLAHGLGTVPKLFLATLVCGTGEAGYTAGDLIPNPGSLSQNISLVPDATNLNIRFSSSANVFGVAHKTTGIFTALTNVNWSVIFSAWA